MHRKIIDLLAKHQLFEKVKEYAPSILIVHYKPGEVAESKTEGLPPAIVKPNQAAPLIDGTGFIEQYKSDDLAKESAAKAFKMEVAEVLELLTVFKIEKAGTRGLVWRNYEDFRTNYFNWIRKKIKNGYESRKPNNRITDAGDNGVKGFSALDEAKRLGVKL